MASAALEKRYTDTLQHALMLCLLNDSLFNRDWWVHDIRNMLDRKGAYAGMGYAQRMGYANQTMREICIGIGIDQRKGV